MADQHTVEGPSTSKDTGGGSESTIELNIKTLDSRLYSFAVDRNRLVSFFKEKIANEIGVPVGQQRLIFRGKVLKDDHLLSEYHVENGHTLHLVERQPIQTQPPPPPGASSGETNGSTGGQVTGATAGAPGNRVGDISHSVVYGTINVGDQQSEGIVPDINRIIGAVLNSFGINGQTALAHGATGAVLNSFGINGQTFINGTTGAQSTFSASQGNEADNRRSSSGPSQAGNQAQPSQAPGQQDQFLPQVLQVPLTGATLPVPSFSAPLPDSLNTLSEFMNRMELALSQNGYNPNASSPSNNTDLPRVELPSNARGVPTPEALSIVLRHAQRLLSDHAIAALSHIAGRLEQEGASTDPAVRGQIQTESTQVGLAMQHLGALFLELARTILSLCMGQSPSESFVNAGPAVYISASSPNPIMVQPFPGQTSPLLGGLAAPPSNPNNFGPLGIGNPPRQINIHIHAGTSAPPIISAIAARGGLNGSRTGSGPGSGTGTGPVTGSRTGPGSGQPGPRAVPLRTVITSAATLPSAVSIGAQPGINVSQSPPPPEGAPPVADLRSFLRSFVRAENQVPLGPTAVAAQPGSNLPPPQPIPEVAEINEVLRSLANSAEPNQLASAQPGSNLSPPQPIPEVAEINEILRSLANSAEPNQLASGQVDSSAVKNRSDAREDPKLQSEHNQSVGSGITNVSSTSSVGGSTGGDASTSSEKHDTSEASKAVPLGLGFGGLQPKRRSKQTNAQSKDGDGAASGASFTQNRNPVSPQQILQSLATRGSTLSATGPNDSRSGQPPPVLGQTTGSSPLGVQGQNGQLDLSNVMSQILHSSPVSGLLEGVSEQTGVVSTDALRGMLHQFSQSPQMMNTVSQIAQQVNREDLGNMFTGLESGGAQGGGGGGGGFDLSRIFQQMMPIVSRALSGGGPSLPGQVPVVGPRPTPQYSERSPIHQNSQVDLQQVAHRIEHHEPPEDIFRAMVENAVHLSGGGNANEDLVNELCNEDEGLAHDFIAILYDDIVRRLEG